MPLPDHISKLTAQAWRDAKKEAGVKGAGFFDGKSGKAIGDKITDYQKNVAAWDVKHDKATSQQAVKSLQDLAAALTVAKKDRTFATDTAKDFQSSIDRLLASIKTAHANMLVQIEKDEKKAADNASSGQTSLAAELKNIMTLADVMKHPVFKKEFGPFCKSAQIEESVAFMLAVAKKTDRKKIVAEFIDGPESKRINIQESDMQDIRDGGDLRIALTEVNGMINGKINVFRTEMARKYKLG